MGLLGRKVVGNRLRDDYNGCHRYTCSHRHSNSNRLAIGYRRLRLQESPSRRHRSQLTNAGTFWGDTDERDLGLARGGLLVEFPMLANAETG